MRDQKQLRIMKKLQEGGARRNGSESLSKNIFQYMNTAGVLQKKNKKLGGVRKRMNRSVSGNMKQAPLQLNTEPVEQLEESRS